MRLELVSSRGGRTSISELGPGPTVAALPQHRDWNLQFQSLQWLPFRTRGYGTPDGRDAARHNHRGAVNEVSPALKERVGFRSA